MRKFLVSLLVLLSLNTYAELPKKFTVYTAYTTLVPLCKTIFNEYDKTYGSESQVLLKPGATGLLAVKAMHSEPELSVVCGTGVSDHVINKTMYPDSTDTLDNLKIVSGISAVGVVFVTGSTSKFNSLPEMLKQNKPLIVGYSSFGVKTVGSEILKNQKIEWVAHKSALDAVASLADGTLDLYVDGSGLIPLIKANKLKSLGHLNHLNASENLLGLDLTSSYPNESKIKLILGVSTSLKNSAADILELENRLKHVHSFTIVQDAIRLAGYKAEYTSSKDSENLFRLFKLAYVK